MQVEDYDWYVYLDKKYFTLISNHCKSLDTLFSPNIQTILVELKLFGIFFAYCIFFLISLCFVHLQFNFLFQLLQESLQSTSRAIMDSLIRYLIQYDDNLVNQLSFMLVIDCYHCISIKIRLSVLFH